MFPTFWHIAIVWLFVVATLFVIAAQAKRRSVMTAASVAIVLGSGAPASYMSWSLFRYLKGELGKIYYGEDPKLSDINILGWAVLLIPWLATLLAALLLIRRRKTMVTSASG